MYWLSCGHVPKKLAFFNGPDVQSTKATLVVLIGIVLPLAIILCIIILWFRMQLEF